MVGAVAAALGMVVVRARRSVRPGEEQVRRLAESLDGRSAVYLRMAECGLARADVEQVARSRGYFVTVHPSMKYYEFRLLPPLRKV